MAGKCGKCGEAAEYVQTARGGWWVHRSTGRHLGSTPVPHDVNTHIEKET